MFSNKKRMAIIGAAVIVLAGAATGIGFAVGSDDDGDSETPITGEALERASAAALEHTGGGRVTDTEAGDEDGAYEVEVTLDDGSQVDVHLDADFNVIGDEAEGEPDDD